VAYKVFLVEDEVAAREGIRDNFDWKSAGFEFSGEAQDGEIALPLIEEIQPDVLITDIKMPFMDGLQLCRIVRERLPWVKIIIVSGYDDFSYAQTAIKLGAAEYLLKPVNVPDLNTALHKVARLLDREKDDREYLKLLRSQVQDNLVLLREKFLLRLVLGGESSISAIEQSQQLGLEIISKCYLILLIKIKLDDQNIPLDFALCQQVERLVSGLIDANLAAFITKQGMDELVLILKGENYEQLEQDGAFLSDLIQAEVEKKVPCKLAIGLGEPHQRLGDLHHSYAEALAKVKDPTEVIDSGVLQKLDQTAIKHFLEFGEMARYDEFFDTAILPLSDSALHSRLLKQYIIVDIVLTAAQFVSDLGGNVDLLIPEVRHGDEFLAGLKILDQVRTGTRKIFATAIAFRDSQVNNNRTTVIHQARAFIDQHFKDSELSLNQVADQVNFSPNHFSAVFSAEIGETFKDYLTRTRIERAKNLLLTTHMKIADVALDCGYNDPHYFSINFRKNVGLTPQQFRNAPGKGKMDK
jgi:two-component system response regulator YesN